MIRDRGELLLPALAVIAIGVGFVAALAPQARCSACGTRMKSNNQQPLCGRCGARAGHPSTRPLTAGAGKHRAATTPGGLSLTGAPATLRVPGQRTHR